MSCFRCCEEDEIQKAADNGGMYAAKNTSGNNGGYHKPEAAPAVTQAVKMQPILVPSIPLNELSEVTDNFGNDALIGEGSYGRVYYGLLKSGQPAAIKKLDASKQPDDEFLAQAAPKLSEDKVRQCVDGRLGGDYPPKAVAKLAAVAALCVQYEADFRPNMSIVVKALQHLLNARPVPSSGDASN
ncbi:Pto-interacting protein 1, partial [Cucurbita argyrosperma subsp. argyrosperma]